MGLDTAYWTAVNQLFLWGSLAIYFVITFTLYSDGTYQIFTSSFPFVGRFRSCKESPSTPWRKLLPSWRGGGLSLRSRAAPQGEGEGAAPTFPGLAEETSCLHSP